LLTQDIEEKLKHALVSQDRSFEDVMKQFDGVLVESMKTRVKLFLQEKRKILANTNTEKSLNELKKSITATPSDPSLKEMWWVMVWWWWADYLKHKTFEKRRNTKVDVKAIESSVDDMVKILEQRSKSAELTAPMKKELQQMIQDVKSTKNYIGSTETLSKWKNLVDAKVLPVDLLKKVKISSAMKESLELIKTQKLTSEFAGKSISEIKTILVSKNITNLSDEVVEMLAKGKTVAHVDDIVHILSESAHLSKFAKIVGKIPILDAAIIGYDIYNYNNSKKTEKDKVHLGITTFANLAGALWPIFCTGPVGWAIVGTAIAVDVGLSHAVDVWYYDIKDEFHQSKKDLADQDIVSLKQLLIESVAGHALSKSSNEAMYDTICRRRGEDDGKVKTIADIISVLIEQSESHLWNDTDPSKNPRIAQRLHFIQSYLPGGRNAAQLSQALRGSKAMGMIDMIVSNSIVYADMRFDKNTQAKDITEYKKEQLWQLEHENPAVFTQLETFLKTDPLQASEFIHQVSACAPALTKDYQSTDDVDWEDTPLPPVISPDVYNNQEEDGFSWLSMQNNSTQNNESESSIQSEETWEKTQKVKTMIDFIHRYVQAKSLTSTLPDVPMVDNKYLSTEQMLVDLADGKPLQTYSQGQSEDFVKSVLLDRNQSDQVENFNRSSDLRQNVIYRLAKSFHGYTGGNTMIELIGFFSEKKEDDANKKGIYYDWSKEQWMINDDYAKDQPLNFEWIDTKSVDEIIKDRTTSMPNWTYAMMNMNPWIWLWLLAVQKFTGLDVKTTKDMIDTKTETPDAQLNQEFVATLRTILTEEKQYFSPEYKTQTTTRIMDYLAMTKPEDKKNIKLPWYLILQAQQAGLGDLSEYYFSYKWWKRKALTVNDRLTAGGGLPGIEVEYIIDKDGAKDKWQLSQEEFDALHPISLTPEKLAITRSLQKILHEIAITKTSLSWVGRGEVSYDPVSEQLSSYDTTTKISIKNGWYILDDGALQMKYKTADEAIHMAMLKNRFDGKYKKQHKKPELQYGSMNIPVPLWLPSMIPWIVPITPVTTLTLRSWLFDNNTWFWSHDTQLLTGDTIEKYFSTSFSEKWREKRVLEYLNS